ncbi:hypothetical protein A3D78_05815 [Candidatus Gottesmanbacteria bacterium RIFCSPHIGHO2_02_FULL_39_14]|uniref:Uncharacterized protein n=1 Tax=Candidatus Gottesmanbacteria bacterium RIFCSPHIGHO2_02_FULL_39_14 TaxID=1798383 RepID=A0A1F6A346_9BACT|nr:MAG: hypothetical protein A3D78_05815 [Candidatus Gottesmanbacteria bacterium RIFCSPHIGHO2_02_FULL_39_14]
MPEWTIFLLSGMAGGLLRALVGLVKSQSFQQKKWEYKPFYFWVTVFTAAVLGMISGILVETSWKLAFLAGYAGSDFLESMYKLSFAKWIK